MWQIAHDCIEHMVVAESLMVDMLSTLQAVVDEACDNARAAGLAL